MKKTQMTEGAHAVSGASSAQTPWESIDWNKIERSVYQLQTRIAKATRQKKYHKVRALQWLLTHSYYAKQLAVKQVTSRKGSRTAGVDRQLWSTSKAKLKAVDSLKRQGYQPQPLKRIYLLKANGRKRPLSIPTMKDRAMQALHLLSVEPVAEVRADLNSYGFRPKRSTADAIEQCFKVLVQKQAATWILEGDIQSCFDKLSHAWLQSHAIMDKKILSKWLAAGYVEKKVWYPTKEGVAQGGNMSPVLMNMALDGLEAYVKKAAPKRHHKVHAIRYADDFIVTAESKAILEEKVKPALSEFLQERGLTLSRNKTRIVNIGVGFTFLGFTVRKYQGKLKITPSKVNQKRFLKEIRDTLKQLSSVKTSVIINQLNLKIRGWANYYRHVYAQDVFSTIDHQIFQALQRWMKRRHPRKGAKWRKERYFCTLGKDHWRFYTMVKNKQGKSIRLYLTRATDIKTTKHIKIKSVAHLYVKEYQPYFHKRELRKKKACRISRVTKEALSMLEPCATERGMHGS